MDEQTLREIEERAEKATPGPWCWEACGQKQNEFVVGRAFAADGKELIGNIEDRKEEVEWDEEIIRYDYLGANENNNCNYGDADFIAHARTDIPALCADVRRLQIALSNEMEVSRARKKIAENQAKVIDEVIDKNVKLMEVVEAAKLAREALVDLGACDDSSCQEPNCNHALPRINEALTAMNERKGEG